MHRQLLPREKIYCTKQVKVYDHNFNTFSDGVVIPHEIYDVKLNEGYITLGASKDTNEFCCDCIKVTSYHRRRPAVHSPSLFPEPPFSIKTGQAFQ
ncbi:ISAzo13-like element transposase-related protein [Methanosarcina horonobensis]|uniref:ISAzo13-like element transposase-related protein n=1 Tax=Methanosarcina horonobensis TaxID=418008 RepID=UPI00373FC72E